MLIRSLGDPSPIVRQAAARYLGIVPDERALQPLIGALNDVDKVVTSKAAMALGSLGDPAACKALIECLKPKHGGLAIRKAFGDLFQHSHQMAPDPFGAYSHLRLHALERLKGNWLLTILLYVGRDDNVEFYISDRELIVEVDVWEGDVLLKTCEYIDGKRSEEKEPQ